MKLSVVILAAGDGKRMKSAVPKVLQKLGGLPLIQRVVNTAKSLDPDQIFVVYGSNKPQVCEFLTEFPVNCIEQKIPRGTGDALLKVIDKIPDDHQVLVLYGDTPLIKRETLENLLKIAPPEGIGLLVAEVSNPTGLGRIIRDQHDDVIAIVEHKDATLDQLNIQEVNTGFLTARASFFKSALPNLKNANAQGEFYLTDVIAMAVKEGKPVKALLVSCEMEARGVNDRKELAALERYFQQSLAEELLLQGVTIVDPQRFDCRGQTDIAADVIIDVNVVFEGHISIGTGSYIGPNCFIKDTKIGENVTIKPQCVIENAVIGDQCLIGPFARIRPDTVLANEVHIGNFVELKKTKVAAKSKVNHLTYLGDTIVGEEVNVGAGTITCNYDGVNKNTTIIEDRVFIGSGTQLVAPVVVAEGAYIGAGSTITQDAPAHQLTLSRVKQQTIRGWKKKPR